MTKVDLLAEIAALGAAPAKDVAFRMNVMRKAMRLQAQRQAKRVIVLRSAMAAGAIGAVAILITPLGAEGLQDVAMIGLALTTGIWATWGMARARRQHTRAG